MTIVKYLLKRGYKKNFIFQSARVRNKHFTIMKDYYNHLKFNEKNFSIITGGGGFLAYFFAEALLEENKKLYLVVNDKGLKK